MQKALLIAEKPSLMRDIKNAYEHCKHELDYDITFISQAGHLVELIDPIEVNPIYKSWDVSLLPINPEHEGGWKYKVTPSCKKLFTDISSEVKSGKYDVIINAGDPEQEGELLIRLVLQKIDNTLPVLRFWSHSTTATDLEKALHNLESNSEDKYENLFKAALIRQHADWLVGMNGSRAVADRIKGAPKIAVGRVMTWLQTMIVDREDEIKNFIPKTVYGVKVTCDNGIEAALCEVTAKTDPNGRPQQNIVASWYNTRVEAENMKARLLPQCTVKKVTKEKNSTYAPKLFNLGKLQSEAGKIGFSAAKTLEIAQSLYEKHYISYPRTDCEVMASTDNFRGIIASAGSVPEFAKAAQYAAGKISSFASIKKFVNDEELAKHGHSALVPTTDKPNFSTLNNEEITIYKMIAKRFLTAFYPPLIQENTTILLDDNGEMLKATGKVVLDAGYTAFSGEDMQNNAIPAVNEGDILTITKSQIAEKTSTCPKRITEGNIIDLMDNPSRFLEDKSIKDDVKDFSIGTAATRAAIIEKLIKDKYIEVKKGTYYPTDFGSFMIHTIRGISVCKTDTTGQWERMLLKIKSGDMTYEEGVAQMEAQLAELLKDIKGVNQASWGDGGQRGFLMKCPGCGKDIIEGPRNFFCTGFRDGCKYSIMKENANLKVKYSANDAKKLFSGEVIEKTLTKDDKQWKQKLRFDPEAKWNPAFVQAEETATDIECPCCKELLVRKGKRISCKACGFGLWVEVCGLALPNDELRYIFEHGKSSGKLKGFTSKAGKSFSAELTFEKNGKESKLNFKF